MTPPRVFISYSYDSPHHTAWVESLADRLRNDGVQVTLDRWELQPGDSIPAFMERALAENPCIVLICTPAYRARFDARAAGVGYEAALLSGSAFAGLAEHRCIPLLRHGEWRDAAPRWIAGVLWLDFRGDPYPEASYADLLTTLRRTGRQQHSPQPAPRSSPTPRQPIEWRWKRLLSATVVAGALTFAVPREFQGPMDLRTAPEALQALRLESAQYDLRAYTVLAAAAILFGALAFISARLHVSRRLRGSNIVWLGRSVSACMLAAASVAFGLLTEQTYVSRNQFDLSAPALAWPVYFAVLYLIAAVGCLIMTFLSPND